MNEKIKIYISYLQESKEMRQKVLKLADALNTNGLDCAIDQYETVPANGWPQWRINRINQADYVLLVCSYSYFQIFLEIGTRKMESDKSACWEKGLIIGQLYENPNTQKIIPIYFGPQNKQYIPLILKQTTSYQIEDSVDFENLYRYLTNQPAVIKPISIKESHKVNSYVSLDDRDELLLEQERISKARNITRWMAVGLTRETAHALEEDKEINKLRFSWDPNEKPICMLVGDYGIGKTLQSELVYQKSIKNYMADKKARIPIFLKSKDVVGNLKNIIEEETYRLSGSLYSNGAIVIIDGADEIGINAGNNLLEEVRFLTEIWGKSSFLITSRPTPMYAQSEETVFLPNFSERDSLRLIKVVSDIDVHVGIGYHWPKSIKDAMKRPLFAILIGIYLKDRDMRLATSVGELLTHLIEKSLPSESVESNKTYFLLQQLAMLTTDRGGKSVPRSEIGFGNEIKQLLESRLVIQENDNLSFALPLFTQWFASQALISGLKKITEIVNTQEILDNWYYAFVILVSTYNHDRVFDIFSPIVKSNPGYASRIVDEGLASWGFSEEVVPPPALECGRRVRATMKSWVDGIGSLATLIAPIKDGRVRTLGVRVSESMLITSWYYGEENIDDIILLSNSDFRNINWPSIFSARPGKQSAWALRWSLNQLQSKLQNLLKNRALPISNGILFNEKMWNSILGLMNKGNLYDKPILLETIQNKINKFDGEAEVIQISREQININEVKQYIDDLIKNDIKELTPPWPCGDLEKYNGWVWGPYSDEKMLERTQFVYRKALEAYNQIVETWFPTFKKRLNISVMQPTRLVGELIISDKIGYEGAPLLHWFFEPSYSGGNNLIDIEIANKKNYDRIKNEWKSTVEKLKSSRPQASGWITSSLHHQVLEIFQSYPVTNIVYKWLWDDLKRISWVDGLIGYKI
jgi:hypothetical protein